MDCTLQIAVEMNEAHHILLHLLGIPIEELSNRFVIMNWLNVTQAFPNHI